ncbi:MAG: hypothetical protein IAF58_00785 [Leptolyngbya sp.]|nr:hypothetical protein [Candidatus Melainabacteria bacterium]
MKSTKRASLLSQIITTAGIIEVEVVCDAYDSSDQNIEEMGRMLVTAGYLADGDLRSAIEAVRQVESNALTPDQAAYALKYAYDNCLPFTSALDSTIMQSVSVVNPNLLGELLMASRLVSEFQLAVAMDQSRDCGITLGRVLILSQIISPSILEVAIDLLRLVRDQHLLFPSAAEALKLCSMERKTLLEALKEMGVVNHDTEAYPKLGALLSSAGLIAEFDAVNAAEIGLETNKPIGQVFNECGLVSSMVLNAALKLQTMIENGTVSVNQSHELLRQVHKLQLPLEELMKELGEMKGKVMTLLIQSGAVSAEDLRKATGMRGSNSTDMTQALVEAGIVSTHLMRESARCVSLMEQGKVRWETASAAILYCRRTGCEFEDAMRQLQIDSSHKLQSICPPALTPLFVGGAA